MTQDIHRHLKCRQHSGSPIFPCNPPSEHRDENQAARHERCGIPGSASRGARCTRAPGAATAAGRAALATASTEPCMLITALQGRDGGTSIVPSFPRQAAGGSMRGASGCVWGGLHAHRDSSCLCIAYFSKLPTSGERYGEGSPAGEAAFRITEGFQGS